MIHNVTVYCSSSAKLDQVFLDAARDLGAAIAAAGWGLVYGGNCVGAMGLLADAARQAGGKVIGVTPQLFIDKGHGDNQCDELIVSNDMRDRKQILINRGDGIVALPGGVGTFEEIFDAIVNRLLEYHHKPIVLLNIAGYYDPVVSLIERGIEGRFIKASTRSLYKVVNTVPETIQYLKAFRPDTSPRNKPDEP